MAGTYPEIGYGGANSHELRLRAGLASGTFYVFRVRARNAAGNSPFSNEAGAATDARPSPACASATALCVNNGRFKIEVDVAHRRRQLRPGPGGAARLGSRFGAVLLLRARPTSRC